jgi:hypothetical protein
VREKKQASGGVATTGLGRELLLFGLVAGVAALHIWVQLEGTLAGYRLAEAQSQQHTLVEELARMRVDLASRRSPGQIEKAARGKLGMIDPPPETIFRVPARPAEGK